MLKPLHHDPWTTSFGTLDYWSLLETVTMPFAPLISSPGFWADRTPVHENGACVNLVTFDSITPLHEASLRGQTQCVEMLLAAGAQVDARNIDGSTPLCDACASGSIDCVKVLLSHGAKVNPPLYTASPLHEACMNGSAECVRLLIDMGANLEAHDCHFGTPLHVACAREHLDCVKILLNAGEPDLGRHALFPFTNYPEWVSSNHVYYGTPLSLSQLCRLSLRRAIGQRGLQKVAQLHIPPRLIEFVSYK
uniref:SOCS box domain-containing protein n=1 Tax=Anolis carolinensis TaxID=28377 RepID=H9G763_ANOCA